MKISVKHKDIREAMDKWFQNDTLHSLDKTVIEKQFLKDNKVLILYLMSGILVDNECYISAKACIDYVSKAITSYEEQDVILCRGDEQFSIPKRDFYGKKGHIYGCFPELKQEALKYFQLTNTYEARTCNYDKETIEVFSFRKFNNFSLSDLINRTITVCNPKLMNDPLDTLLYEWLKIKNANNSSKDISSFIPSINHARDLYVEATKNYRIRSFCTERNGVSPFESLLMWAHYADGHKGFCIKYSLSNNFFNYKDESKGLHCMNYINYKDDYDIKNDEDCNGYDMFFRKSKEWEYENEIRLLTYIFDVSNDTLSIPLDKKSNILAIYFGIRCPNETIITIRKILESEKDIKFYKMQTNPKNIYKLEYTELT